MLGVSPTDVMQCSRHLIAAVAILAMSACKACERPMSHYATRAEAVSAGAFDRGWLPSLVPASARELVEQHDIDTNETWLSFAFRPHDRDPLRAACTRKTANDIQFPRAVDWWPSTLTRPDSGANVDFFSCPEDGFRAHLAVHRSSDIAWFWRIP